MTTRKSDSIEDRRQNPWAMVENELLRDSRISPQCKALYGLLITYGPQSIFPGQETLAECMGTTRQTIKRWLDDLRLQKLIDWENRTGTSNKYYILGYANFLAMGVTPALHPCNTSITPHVIPTLHDLEPVNQNHKEEGGADAQPALDDSWPTEPAEHEPKIPTPNPSDVAKARMREKFGPDLGTMILTCQESQAAEGAWTVPVYSGLSPACAVVKASTGYSPAKAVRSIIDESIPGDLESLEMWSKVCTGWMLCGYSYKNVGGMLECYAEGRVPTTKPDGKKNGGASTPQAQPDSPPVIGPAETDWL